MGIDLKKVNAEIADLKSMLAVIDRDIDECRLRYFEHPWAWSQRRRTLTFERHRVQRRLEELTFVCSCVRARPLESATILSFASLASLGERNAEGLELPDQATCEMQPDEMQPNRPALRVIQGGCF
jgi:hypothetical protein